MVSTSSERETKYFGDANEYSEKRKKEEYATGPFDSGSPLYER